MKPSGRFKRRYVSFSLSVAGMPPSTDAARKIIHEHFLSFYGELGISELAFKLVEYDQKSGRGIIRCARGGNDKAIFCMACMHEWEGKTCRLEPITTSGSVRKALKG
ncbi:TPA: hypothetical protein HA243_05445 [Candidatus Micrarchaeota archaeon]|nr:hypothetical protein [Candidatus Micrarchaeota archaeon]